MEGTEENQKNTKKSMVLLTVIGVATLLVAIVGATFAYFSTTVTNGNNATPANISTGNTGTITYAQGNTINMTGLNLTESWTGFLPFSIHNGGSVAQKIVAEWTNVSNTLCKYSNAQGTACVEEGTTGAVPVLDDFTWTLYTATSINGLTAETCDDGTVVSQGNLATVINGTDILDNTTSIAAGATNNYVLVLKFNYLADAPAVAPRQTNLQNYQQGKTFTGKMNVEWVGV